MPGFGEQSVGDFRFIHTPPGFEAALNPPAAMKFEAKRGDLKLEELMKRRGGQRARPATEAAGEWLRELLASSPGRAPMKKTDIERLGEEAGHAFALLERVEGVVRKKNGLWGLPTVKGGAGSIFPITKTTKRKSAKE